MLLFHKEGNNQFLIPFREVHSQGNIFLCINQVEISKNNLSDIIDYFINQNDLTRLNETNFDCSPVLIAQEELLGEAQQANTHKQPFS